MIARRTSRILMATAVGLTAALGLAGCNLIPTLGDAIAPHVTADPTDPAATPKPSYEALNLGSPPANMTSPGTSIPLGKGAWVMATPTDGPGTEPVGIAVIDIVAGDETFWDDFQNSDEFAGDIPHFVVIQQTFPNRAGATEAPAGEDVWPQRADGSNAEFLTLYGAPAKDSCDVTLPEWDATTGTMVTCLVAIGSADNPVTTAYYNGLGQFTFTYDEDDIYADQPIVWS